MDERVDQHNTSVAAEVAEAGLCGQVHMPSGRTCILNGRHDGPCDFAPAEKVEEVLNQQ